MAQEEDPRDRPRTRDAKLDYADWLDEIARDGHAEPNTFTTRSHQETVRALLAKQERAQDR
jgi:hypothetical protein